MYSCEESRNHDQDVSMNEKTFVKTRGTHLCAIFLVKPDVTIQDRALGSVIGYIPIFSQYSPCMSLHLKTPNSECCEAQSILIVVSHAEKRVPCAVVQE